MWELFAIIILFAIGLRLSAFFSGNELGYYRVSQLRLTVDAQSGDELAERMLWFARHPSSVVATTLVGNNIANYLCTLAIGLAVAQLGISSGWGVEVMSTLLLTPLVFLVGELLPKSLYYRSPMMMLRRNAGWFEIFYRVLLVFSLPLMWLSKIFERYAGSPSRQLDIVLGRSRLVQVLGEGHREGLMTDVQGRLVHGLMHSAPLSVAESVTPPNRIFGLPDTATREEILDFAKRYGLAAVPLRGPEGWYGYVRTAELAISTQSPKTRIRHMPKLSANATKLEALIALREARARHGAVYRDDQFVGIVYERGLLEQLLRAPQAIGARPRLQERVDRVE